MPQFLSHKNSPQYIIHKYLAADSLYFDYQSKIIKTRKNCFRYL